MKTQLLAIVLGLVSASALAQCPRNCPHYSAPAPRPEPRPEPVRPEPQPERPIERQPQQQPRQEAPVQRYEAPQRHEAQPDIHATPEQHYDNVPRSDNRAPADIHVQQHFGELHQGIRTENTYRKFSDGPAPHVHVYAFAPGFRITDSSVRFTRYGYVGAYPLHVGWLAFDIALALDASHFGQGCGVFYAYDDYSQVFNQCGTMPINMIVAMADGEVINGLYLQQGWVRDDGTDGGNAILPPGAVWAASCVAPFAPQFVNDQGGSVCVLP